MASGSSTPPRSASNVAHRFTAMGFSKMMVEEAIKKIGEDNFEAILDVLVTYNDDEKPCSDDKHLSNEPSEKKSHCIHISDDDDCSSATENQDDTLSILVGMGYNAKEVSTAMDKLGQDADISEFIDHICAARLQKELEGHLNEPPYEDKITKPKDELYFSTDKKRKLDKHTRGYNCKESGRRPMDGDDHVLHLPNPMIGFGVPGNQHLLRIERTLPALAAARPYFYYENVALTPKGVWHRISSFLYEVEPEFVDSIHFCAAARKRGYIHNLPITNRVPLLPIPPLTIQEAFPLMKRWWPTWDKRSKLNCIRTKVAPATLTEKIRCDVERYGDNEPPPDVMKDVLEKCRRWNLVWVGKNKVATLDPDELEFLLGFPKGHTRGISITNRYIALGNSFQVDTVAYHLSVLKGRFPNGINVLSLFSGIGGAEVALHRLGIGLRNVVSVEKSEVSKGILKSWWEQTNQQGNLIEVADVEEVTVERVEQWMRLFGGFDLVIGGSPCNNLAGGNRVSRDGLNGEQSSLFFDYFRILDLVKAAMVGSV